MVEFEIRNRVAKLRVNEKHKRFKYIQVEIESYDKQIIDKQQVVFYHINIFSDLKKWSISK